MAPPFIFLLALQDVNDNAQTAITDIVKILDMVIVYGHSIWFKGFEDKSSFNSSSIFLKIESHRLISNWFFL